MSKKTILKIEVFNTYWIYEYVMDKDNSYDIRVFEQGIKNLIEKAK